MDEDDPDTPIIWYGGDEAEDDEGGEDLTILDNDDEVSGPAPLEITIGASPDERGDEDGGDKPGETWKERAICEAIEQTRAAEALIAQN